ncbi:MAG: hypothetical protein HY896_06700 [Deltaproteobacteria bacterium]|nr:hypothetical protein [Deltaproteobacteria bacterium]
MESRALLVFLSLMAVSGLIAGTCSAEGLSGYLEAGINRTDTTNVDAAGQSARTSADSFTQKYSITLDRKIYPNLGLLAGGLFEKQDSAFESGGVETDSTSTRIRPFVGLNFRTPLYSADAGYNRSEEKRKTSGLAPFATVRETWSSAFQWKPDGFPDVKLEYFRTDNFDKERRVTDTTDSRFGVTSQYRPVTPLFLRYQLSVGDREDRLTDTTVEDVNHTGKIVYSDRLWQRRVSVNSDYSFVRDEVRTAVGGGGEVGFRIFFATGLSGISNTPENVRLETNTLLTNGDLVASAGIDLGLPSAGEDANQRNMGLDFGADTEVNTMLVTVVAGGQDAAEVADSFSWRIYTSSNNQDWVLRQTVSPATFNAFLQRFEIRFLNVTARFIKVVVSPLSLATPNATRFPDILVTELQAEVRRPASEITGKTVSTSHLYNLDIRTRILDSPSLYHEFSYFLRKAEPSPSIYTVSNGLAYQQQYSRVFSGRARISREDGKERAGTRVAYLYTASVAAVPYDTLRHSLVFSGSDETTAGSNSTANSLYLYNSARLYEGIDANLGGGASRSISGTGRRTDQTQVNASATLVPHPVAVFNLGFTDSSAKTKGGETIGERKDITRSWEANAGLTPVRTIYLFGSYRIEHRDEGGEKSDRRIRNYTANWAPFPDGTLHLNFFYNETVRPEDNSRERSVIPSLRWNISSRSYLDISYQDLKTVGPALSTATKSYGGTFHVGF